MSPVKFPPTAEQITALEMYATGKSMKIEAGAGTGKTSTLQLLAEADPRRVQYVAFNKKIVEESKSKMPRNVRCNTAHSLAYGAIGHKFQNRHKNRMRSWEIATVLGINQGLRVEAYTGDAKWLSPERLAGITMAAIERWCQTADPEATYLHTQPIKGLDDPMHHGPRAQRLARSYEVGKQLEVYMKRAWKDLCLYTDGALRFNPGHYLKMWQLSQPRIASDVIMFDEAQDASPVLIDVVARQGHAQVVWVGDTNQQIYEFTGAVNALAKVPVENTGYLSQSFRFGPAIAEVANGMLSELHSPLRLTGFDEIESTVEPVAQPRAILTRTNATAVRELLTLVSEGRTGHLQGGGADVLSFARAAQALMDGGQTDHPELFCFDTWDAVLSYVDDDELGADLALLVKLVTEFGVPTIERALADMPDAKDADTIISTAHKSKGLQWTSVRLASDFSEEPDEAELRLLYVACTRAEHRLDITEVPVVAILRATQAAPSSSFEAPAPQEAAGASANGGQHKAPAAPENAPVAVLGGGSDRLAVETVSVRAAERLALAFHEATGLSARVIDGYGTIVTEHEPVPA